MSDGFKHRWRSVKLMAHVPVSSRDSVRTRRCTVRGAAMGLLVFAGLAVLPANAQDRSQGRSMVISRGGIVAAESPLAAEAGATILARGGNAIDAMVATNAVMGVVEPMMNGMGGDLFAIVYIAKTGKLYGLNASGWSPAKLTIGFLKAKGITKMPQFGIDTVTVPGTVDGWSKLLARFGTRKLSDVLDPAIAYARDGVPVPEWDADYWSQFAAALHANANLSRTYLIDGHTPRVGEVFRNPDLAWSLEQVAKGGRDAFYKGAIADKIVALSRKHGGAMTAEDLADYSSQWVQPISTTYHGWTVYELPPNGQGIATLMMLNIMKRFPLARYGHNSADALQVMIEAKKLAYADLLRYVADPRFSHVPVAAMLSTRYAAARAALIDMSRANCNVAPGEPTLATKGDTTYMTAVDSQGNMVSLIQSNYWEFGSRLMADGTGFVLQDRGALFTLDPSSPDALAGHKRPLHTIIPAFMQRGQDRIAFGIMGGFNQAQAHAQFVSNIVDYGMDIQAALEAPRFTQMTFNGCGVDMEDRIPEAVRKTLAVRGHEIESRGDYSEVMGGGQAVMRDFKTAVNYGASDPRKDGEAIPQPIR